MGYEIALFAFQRTLFPKVLNCSTSSFLASARNFVLGGQFRTSFDVKVVKFRLVAIAPFPSSHNVYSLFLLLGPTESRVSVVGGRRFFERAFMRPECELVSCLGKYVRVLEDSGILCFQAFPSFPLGRAGGSRRRWQ